MASNTAVKLAVLIDADNAQPSVISLVLAEVAKYGTAFVKRAYGDWTGTSLKGWKERLLENSIQPIQQFAYAQGKNATDAAMVIDAMDLLYSNRFDGFCLVSSDSDFTRLASRIRESGLVVYGCGERKTPKPFVTACDKFIYVENLRPRDALMEQVARRITPVQAVESYNYIEWLQSAVEATSEEDGWANLANVGHLMTKRHSDFDPRTYGYKKLGELIAATPTFDVTKRTKDGKPAVVYIREKKNTKQAFGSLEYTD